MMRHRSVLPAVAVLAAALGGCEVELTVNHYPRFYEPSLKTVAVVPFANASLRPRAGDYFAARLAEALAENGTYEVLDPADLTERLEKAGLKMPQRAKQEQIAAALRKLGGVDAFLVGSVRAFSADRSAYTEIDDFYPGFGWSCYPGWYSHGYYPGWYGYGYGGGVVYRYYEYTRAVVAVDAALVRVADGAVLQATPGTLTARIRSRDGRAETTDQALVQAARAAAERLVREFAVAPRKIKIDKGKSLRTARPGREPGSLKFTDDFRLDEPILHVILALPPEADRNEFRITITPRGRDEPVAAESVTWSRDDDRLVLSFVPRDLAEAAGGPGKFDLRLHSGGRAVIKRDFRIKR